MIKKIVIVLLGVFVLIQFIRPTKNLNATVTDKDITRLYAMPDSVQHILQKACYDCHSNNTRYPWYNNIQPVAWWLNRHVNEGKGKLNFSEFGAYPVARRIKKLKGTAREVQKGDMPLSSYLWIHTDARLTDKEKQLVISWANNLSQQIAKDSLANK